MQIEPGVGRRWARWVAFAAVALALFAAGCGLGGGSGARDVRLTVTRDFGARMLGGVIAPTVPAGETALRLLERNFRVETRYGGGFVQSVDGVGGGTERGRRVDWFFYVNGIEADRGAAATAVKAGDRIWWDRRDWTAAMDVRAVVGSFPEPFRSGLGGRRLPTRIECAAAAGAACDEVARRLEAVGVPSARGALTVASGPELLRVLVGPWSVLRNDPAAAQLERGPGASGVYARPEAGGRRIAVLDPAARVARVLGAGTGLVAATRYRDERPTWIVTGTDAPGVLAAARGLEEGVLANRFALAVAGGLAVRVPLVGGGP